MTNIEIVVLVQSLVLVALSIQICVVFCKLDDLKWSIDWVKRNVDRIRLKVEGKANEEKYDD